MIRRWVRRTVAPLRRRIFLWFGAAIVLAALVSWGAAIVVGGGPPEWRRDVEGMKRLGSNRFAEVWDDHAKRRALAQEFAAELRVDVTVRDASGAAVETVGDTCAPDHHSYSLKPIRDGVALGRVDLCRGIPVRKPIAAVVSFFAAIAVLWAIAAKVARHLGRPLESLMRATADIGKGRYDVDVRVHRRAPIEIQRLAEAVSDMASKIKGQMADQRELLASVSHEVRSPLARIRLLLELLRDDPTPDARVKLLADLEHEVEEIDDLVGRLLASSRVDFSALTLRENDLVAAAKRALDRAGVPGEPRVVGEASDVRCDATLVARALANLLDNAAKHAGGAKALVVRFERGRVGLEVEDDGPGFSDGESDRAFDAFYGRPKGGHDSLGLGLALVKRIAQAHGGDAFARNRDPNGAAVGFWIPNDPEKDARPASSSQIPVGI